MSLDVMMHDVIAALENTCITDGVDPTNKPPYQHNSIIHKGVDDHVSKLNNDMDNNEHCDEGFHQVEQICDENELWGIEFEDLVLTDEPQLILQLIL